MKVYYFILGTLQLITAIGALPSGYLYIADPSGSRLGASADLLANSPFDSFLIPGLFLFFVNGIAHLIASVMSFFRCRYAGQAGIILGVFLISWIILQVWWISLSSALQPLFLATGIANTWLGWRILRANQQSKIDSSVTAS